MRSAAVAIAPATVGNMAVGFDVLGCSVPVLGDTVRAGASPNASCASPPSRAWHPAFRHRAKE
jgi:homoserine kinase